jgi:hypothetical protein
MKKIILGIAFVSVSCMLTAQKTCEQREDKLLLVMETFSAGFLYNTYGVIGSISDGFINKSYSAETVTNLLQSQSTLAENIIKIIDDLQNGNFLKEKKHQDYCESVKTILNGLKIQSNLMIDYAKRKTSAKQVAIEEARKKNWSDINKLMGIDE